METYWYHVSVARYNEYRSLIFNNKKFRYFVITNQSSYALREPGFQNGQWYEENLVKIFSYLRNLDVAYYNNAEFKHIDEKYNLDSEEDFKKFARDHYGELGLSRLDICASNFQRKGWVIDVYNSYSANVDVAIDVATAIYKSGAPLEISDAEKLLKILNEEDYVGLMPYTYHDYMNHHEEGTVYELPWEYQLHDGCDDSESLLTKAQYDEIVSLAE